MSKADPIILFLHGINNTGNVWQAVIAALPSNIACAHPTLIPLNSVDQIAEALIDSIKGDLILVGHSFGGYVALAILELIPERVKGIVLINSQASSDLTSTRARRLELIHRAATESYESVAQSAAQLVFHSSSLRNAELMRVRDNEIKRYGANRYTNHQYACLSRPDRSAVLKAFSGPKLIIAAEDDLVISAVEQEKMANDCCARFVKISKTGHMLPAEEPDKVTAELLSWLTSYSLS